MMSTGALRALTRAEQTYAIGATAAFDLAGPTLVRVLATRVPSGTSGSFSDVNVRSNPTVGDTINYTGNVFWENQTAQDVMGKDISASQAWYEDRGANACGSAQIYQPAGAIEMNVATGPASDTEIVIFSCPMEPGSEVTESA